jgi:hypothetical protein
MNGRLDDRGSAFGGAILLMATVILLILTAAMFFGDIGFDSHQTEMPDPELDFDYTENPEASSSLQIRHVEGARINPAQLTVELSGASCTGSGDPNGQYSATGDFGLAKDNWLAPNMVLVIDDDNPGQLCSSGDLRLEGSTVRMLWTDPEGSQQTIEHWDN